MQERLLQFIWQHGYFSQQEMHCSNGLSLSILQRGTYNTDQGPDFNNARIKISDTIWAGNIEIHIRSSEWIAHGHEGDPHYNGVILHVVWEQDRQVNPIPVLELKDRVSGLLLAHYESLMMNPGFIACQGSLSGISELIRQSWLARLLTERLGRKADILLAQLNNRQYNWEEICWWQLAHCFGNRQNASAFEAMAKTLPLRLLARHRGQIHQVEALLFGQAGLLSGRYRESYPIMLQKEYRYLRKKYQLEPIGQPLYFLRMRPVNFPSVRLAQLASLLQQSPTIFSQLREATSLTDLRNLFSVTANDYWHYHFRFEETSAYQQKKLGLLMQDHLLLNGIFPLLVAYGRYHSQPVYGQRVLDWCGEMKPEQNRLTNGFRDWGWKPKKAGDSQAMIELKQQYCDEKRCLDCAIGYQLLQPTAEAVKPP